MSAEAPYVECSGCRGWGILLGPRDPETGKREVREHHECGGWGIKIRRTHRDPRPHGNANA